MVRRLALVTGGNRGLGFEACRQLALLDYQVILTSRDLQKGKIATNQLCNEGLDVTFMQLDVASYQSIRLLYQEIESKWHRIDVLINNAAVLLDKNIEMNSGEEILKKKREVLEETLRTNVVGPYELCERFIPLMLKQNYGRIVNISSGAGQLSEPHEYYILYSISKTALNAITSFLSARLQNTNVLINSVCPGWVKTDMGGPQAIRSIEEGVKGIIWAATLPDGGPNGGFFRDGQSISW